MIRAIPLLALSACLHVPAPKPSDVAACVVPRVVVALTVGVALPVLSGERSGTIALDATGCGPGVVDPIEAQRIGDEVARAAPGIVALVKLSDDPCVDVWAESVGVTVDSVARSLPSALAGTGSLVVEWGVPECGP